MIDQRDMGAPRVRPGHPDETRILVAASPGWATLIVSPYQVPQVLFQTPQGHLGSVPRYGPRKPGCEVRGEAPLVIAHGKGTFEEFV